MIKKKLVYLGLLMSLTLTACGTKEDTGNVIEEAAVVETEMESEVIEEVVAEEETTVEDIEEVEIETIIPYGEENGFEYTTETSFNLPWVFEFTTSDFKEKAEYPGLSVNKYDAITEFKSVKYKDEGDTRTVELTIDNICSYQLVHEFTGEGGSFSYVYSFVPVHPGDIYTGTLYAHENTSDEKNFYDTTTTLDMGDKAIDVQVKKIEDSVVNKDGWVWNDEYSETNDCSVVKTYTYQLTYPKDYDGVVFCLVKAGAEEVFWEYQEEKVNEAEPILDECTVDDLIFVKLNDLIATIGEEVDNVTDMEAKVEEIRVRREEAAKAEAEAKAQAEAEAAKRAEEDAMMNRTIDEMTEEEIKAMEEKWGITFIRE